MIERERKRGVNQTHFFCCCRGIEFNGSELAVHEVEALVNGSPSDDALHLSVRGRVLPVLRLNGPVQALHAELGVLALLSVRVDATPPQVGLQVAEDDTVAWHHDPGNQRQESPVLDIDTTVRIWGGGDANSRVWLRVKTTACSALWRCGQCPYLAGP